jgi:hypothetical protein
VKAMFVRYSGALDALMYAAPGFGVGIVLSTALKALLQG